MDYIYTTKGQSGREEWNYVQWQGLRLEGDWSGSEVLSRLSRVFEEVLKGSKTFQKVQRRFEGCQGLDAMRAPGWGSICGGEVNAFKAEVVDQARGTRV